MNSLSKPLIVGANPLPAPAELYGLAIGPLPRASLDWLGTVVDRSRLFGVGPEPIPGVPWIPTDPAQGGRQALLTGLLHILTHDPEAMVVIAHGPNAPNHRCLRSLVHAIAAVVDDPGRCVRLIGRKNGPEPGVLIGEAQTVLRRILDETPEELLLPCEDPLPARQWHPTAPMAVA